MMRAARRPVHIINRFEPTRHNRMRFLLLGIAALALVGVNDARALPIEVFLLGGQSNMDGRAPVSGLPTSPVNLQQPQTDVLFYHSDQGWDSSATADRLIFLQPGTAEFGPAFGPAITFGRKMADDFPDQNFALIKSANGGTSLYADWNPSGGAEYTKFKETVSNGMDALVDAGYTPEIAGMLWMQGEADARFVSTAAAYEANLRNFIDDVRIEYADPTLPFLIGEVFTNAYGARVSFGQAAVAAADPNVGFITTRDLSFQDPVHFDANGQIELGRRFASAYQQIVPEPATLSLVAIGCVFMAGLRRSPRSPRTPIPTRGRRRGSRL